MTSPAPPRRRWFSYSLRTLFVLVTLFCVGLGVQVKWNRDRTSPVPWQNMWIYFEDEDAVATIRSKAFRVAFAGHSFGSHRRSGNYVVDGRYGFGSNRSWDGEAGGGVDWTYSQQERL